MTLSKILIKNNLGLVSTIFIGVWIIWFFAFIPILILIIVHFYDDELKFKLAIILSMVGYTIIVVINIPFFVLRNRILLFCNEPYAKTIHKVYTFKICSTVYNFKYVIRLFSLLTYYY
jgi:hypothetical protein